MQMSKEAKMEILCAESDINRMAREVESYALRLKEEMDTVLKTVDYIKVSPEKIGHCQLNPSDLTAWRNLPRAIARLDAKIKGLNTMKSVLREMGIE